MNLGELKQHIRAVAQDVSEFSRLWTDEEIIQYVNDGQIEACRNAPWILKTSSMSVGEVKPKSILTVDGFLGNGTVSKILVNNQNIITNPVTYNNDNSLTASLLSNEINDTGLFTATVNGAVITIEPVESNGSFYNNQVPLIVATSNYLTATQFTGGIDGICRIQLKPNVKEYTFSNKLLKIESFYLGENQKKLAIKDFRDLCDNDKNLAKQKGSVECILYGLGSNSFYVARVPTVKDYINMTVYHLPLKSLRANSDIPEIPEYLHSKLVHYALYKMYMKNDIEGEQMDISNFHYSKFIEEFGDNQFGAISNKNNEVFFFGG